MLLMMGPSRHTFADRTWSGIVMRWTAKALSSRAPAMRAVAQHTLVQARPPSRRRDSGNNQVDMSLKEENTLATACFFSFTSFCSSFFPSCSCFFSASSLALTTWLQNLACLAGLATKAPGLTPCRRTEIPSDSGHALIPFFCRPIGEKKPREHERVYLLCMCELHAGLRILA